MMKKILKYTTIYFTISFLLALITLPYLLPARLEYSFSSYLWMALKLGGFYFSFTPFVLLIISFVKSFCLELKKTKSFWKALKEISNYNNISNISENICYHNKDYLNIPTYPNISGNSSSDSTTNPAYYNMPGNILSFISTL